MKQISFATLAESVKKRKTKRERFLEEMEAVVPWAALMALIEPHYPKTGNGHRPRGLETMLRIYFMQQWLALSDPGMEDALYDVPCVRAFARLDLFDESMPDETTILKFRRLLEMHQLTAAIMNAINDTLEQQGLLLKGGTMVDATIIHVAASTKNKAKHRDLKIHQTEGKPVVFRHEDSCRRRCEQRPGPYGRAMNWQRAVEWLVCRSAMTEIGRFAPRPSRNISRSPSFSSTTFAVSAVVQHVHRTSLSRNTATRQLLQRRSEKAGN